MLAHWLLIGPYSRCAAPDMRIHADALTHTNARRGVSTMKKALWFCFFAGIVAGCSTSESSESSADVSLAESELLAPLSTCTAVAWCCNDSMVTCNGSNTCSTVDFDADPNGVGWVQCDGAKTYCTSCSGGGGTPACPGLPQIQEYIHPCYPSIHPHGRYGVLNADPTATYKWSGTYVSFPGGTSGSYVVLKPTSVGGYTVKVTVSKPGCPSVTGFANYYAAACGGSGDPN
jgi:hypothetical protein